jgi:hypothetical protein
VKTIKFLAVIAFFGSVVWFFVAPDYEPAIAIVTSLSALIVAWGRRSKEKAPAGQTQSVQGEGVGVQAGGDVTMGSINKRTSKDA